MTPDGWTETKMKAAFSSRKEKGEAGLPVLSVTLRDGLKRRDELDRKMDSELAPEGHLRIRKGDIAYNMMRMWQGASGQAQYDGIVSPAYVVLAPTAEVDSDFMTYLLKHDRTIYDLWAYSYGLTSDRLRLYFNDFCNVPLNLPPLPEQKKIAKILSTWDQAIETTDKLITNAGAQKKALMQQLLTGRKRMGGHRGEWAVRKLSEFCEVRRGASPRPISSTKWFADEGRGWVRISDVTSSQTERLEATTQYLSKEGISKSVSVDPGDLIMSICATIGVPKFLGIPACIHDGFVVFREINNELDPGFLYFVLESATEKLANAGQPGTQKNLNTTIVGNIPVPAISLDEQIKISDVLRAADDEVRGLKKQYASLIEQKHSLMHQLLTGKNRVKLDGGA